MKQKRCTQCKASKALNLFNKASNRKDGLQTKCRECSRCHAKKYYVKNKKIMVPMIMAKKKERMKAVHLKIFEYLSHHPCVDCGETDVVVLDFDHVRGTKRSDVGNMIRRGNAWKTLLKEIAKCEVRCSNCHRRKTAKEYKHYRYTLAQL